MTADPAVPAAPGDLLKKWFYPGGDVDQLHQSAAACTALANTIDEINTKLSTAGKATLPHFKGAAAGALEDDLAHLGGDLSQLGGHLRTAADALTQQAAIKAEQIRQSHVLWAVAAVTAITLIGEAVIATTAAEAMAVAAEASAGAVAAGVAETAAETTLSRALAGMAELLPRIAKSHLVYTGTYLGSQYLVKTGQHLSLMDPSTWGPAALAGLDPNNYTADDLSIVLSSIPMDVVFLGALSSLGILGKATTAATEGNIGGIVNGSATAYGAFAVAGNALTDLGAWGSVGWGGALGYLGGLGAAKYAEPIATFMAKTPVGSAFEGLVGPTGTRIEDFARTVLTLPADVSVSAAASSRAPVAPPAVTAPNVPLAADEFGPAPIAQRPTQIAEPPAAHHPKQPSSAPKQSSRPAKQSSSHRHHTRHHHHEHCERRHSG